MFLNRSELLYLPSHFILLLYMIFCFNHLSLLHSKTAIAIDAIINQKRFNDGADESKFDSMILCTGSRVVFILIVISF